MSASCQEIENVSLARIISSEPEGSTNVKVGFSFGGGSLASSSVTTGESVLGVSSPLSSIFVSLNFPGRIFTVSLLEMFYSGIFEPIVKINLLKNIVGDSGSKL